MATLDYVDHCLPYVAAIIGGPFLALMGISIVFGFTQAMLGGIGYPFLVDSIVPALILLLGSIVVIWIATSGLPLFADSSRPTGQLGPAIFVGHWLSILTAAWAILFILGGRLFGLLGLPVWAWIIVVSVVVLTIGGTAWRPLYRWALGKG